LRDRGLSGTQLVISDHHSGLMNAGPMVRAQVETVAGMLEPQFPTVATMLRDALEQITAFAGFPEAHSVNVWSTNPLERLNREVKRRPTSSGSQPRRPAAPGSLRADRDP